MRSVTFVSVLAAALLGVVSPIQAAVPPLINYQGRLTDSAGSPRPDGQYSITFTIYDDSTNGNPVWTETQTNVTIRGGLFTGLLGTVNPIADSVFAKPERWLALAMGGGAELLPRTRLVSVGYAQRVGTVDGASGGRMDGDFLLSGNVSIGSTTPTSRFEVGNATGVRFRVNTDDGLIISNGDFQARNGRGDVVNLTVQDDGKVGVGTTTPTDRFVVGNADGARFRVNTDDGLIISNGDFQARNGRGDVVNLAVQDGGNVGIGTSAPSQRLEVVGTTKTQVLEITGGSDLAEPFEISHAHAPRPGAVVVIDDENPGKLNLSDRAYDTRVAGVISGAGGVKPGLTLRQEGVLDTGHNVAIGGRAYVLATTTNGPIKPGDLLTTSDIPGLAMKATDPQRAFGAVVGKAMTGLESGEGLVLVLVNLQ